MARSDAKRVWWTRLRWRTRGAWQWPAFGVFVVVDAVLLRELPLSGQGPALFGALLLSAFFNLVVVAVGAPLLGRLVRRRRPDLPRVVANDYAGAGAVVALALALVGAGLAHRPAAIAEQRSYRAQSDAVRRYVAAHAAAVYRRNIDRADTWKLDRQLYRTCVPSGDPLRSLCMFVDTAHSPPDLRLDPNRAPNSLYIGPHAIGNAHG